MDKIAQLRHITLCKKLKTEMKDILGSRETMWLIAMNSLRFWDKDHLGKFTRFLITRITKLQWH